MLGGKSKEFAMSSSRSFCRHKRCLGDTLAHRFLMNKSNALLASSLVFGLSLPDIGRSAALPLRGQLWQAVEARSSFCVAAPLLPGAVINFIHGGPEPHGHRLQ